MVEFSHGYDTVTDAWLLVEGGLLLQPCAAAAGVGLTARRMTA